MHVYVKLYASLRQHVPQARYGVPLEVEVSPGTRLVDLFDQLQLPAQQVKVIFVNGIIRPAEWVLQPEDQVGIFPPVAGG